MSYFDPRANTTRLAEDWRCAAMLALLTVAEDHHYASDYETFEEYTNSQFKMSHDETAVLLESARVLRDLVSWRPPCSLVIPQALRPLPFDPATLAAIGSYSQDPAMRQVVVARAQLIVCHETSPPVGGIQVQEIYIAASQLEAEAIRSCPDQRATRSYPYVANLYDEDEDTDFRTPPPSPNPCKPTGSAQSPRESRLPGPVSKQIAAALSWSMAIVDVAGEVKLPPPIHNGIMTLTLL
ncbi:hypothetical protein BC828DRAFT_402936 [Blastocladiella britannica]|nr:hypothetical protein BC828DRAFT_402936 [Blastocladiella britannica]